jgi:hypothetical protein
MQPIDLLVVVAGALLVYTSQALVEYIVKRLAKLVSLLPQVLDRLGQQLFNLLLAMVFVILFRFVLLG